MRDTWKIRVKNKSLPEEERKVAEESSLKTSEEKPFLRDSWPAVNKFSVKFNELLNNYANEIVHRWCLCVQPAMFSTWLPSTWKVWPAQKHYQEPLLRRSQLVAKQLHRPLLPFISRSRLRESLSLTTNTGMHLMNPSSRLVMNTPVHAINTSR